jgi:phosphohistidine phosphatase SixA
MFHKLISILVISAFVLLFAANKVGVGEIADGRDSSLFEAIQKGGYILYLRHGESTIGQDQPGLNFSDCVTQRNLNEKGKDQARMMGNIFREKMIPIQYPVISSPYCRARETAEIAFGKQNIMVNPFLASIEKLKEEGFPIEEKQKILSNLTKIFETPPARGINTVIVAHTFPRDIALGEIPDMGTVVIKPKGKGNGYEVVSTMNLEEFIVWTYKSVSGSTLKH